MLMLARMVNNNRGEDDAMSTLRDPGGAMPADLTLLMNLERQSWGERFAALHASGVPLMAADEDAAKAAAEQAEKDAKDAEAAADAAKAKQAEPVGEKGIAALAAERARADKAVKDAKEAREAARAAQDELDKLKAKDLSDAEREKKRADDAEAMLETLRADARKANLVTALHAANIAHPKAAARLLDGVEYDEQHEPTNLTDALTAAKAAYGEDMFGPARRQAPNINPGAGGGGDTGDGPKLTAEELAAAEAQGMSAAEYAHYQDPQAGPYKPAGKT